MRPGRAAPCSDTQRSSREGGLKPRGSHTFPHTRRHTSRNQGRLPAAQATQATQNPAPWPPAQLSLQKRQACTKHPPLQPPAPPPSARWTAPRRQLCPQPGQGHHCRLHGRRANKAFSSCLRTRSWARRRRGVVAAGCTESLRTSSAVCNKQTCMHHIAGIPSQLGRAPHLATATASSPRLRTRIISQQLTSRLNQGCNCFAPKASYAHHQPTTHLLPPAPFGPPPPAAPAGGSRHWRSASAGTQNPPPQCCLQQSWQVGKLAATPRRSATLMGVAWRPASHLCTPCCRLNHKQHAETLTETLTSTRNTRCSPSAQAHCSATGRPDPPPR